MIQLRRASERGHADFGWLDSRHTFSFGSYHDPAHMGFRNLRVINEDRVAKGKGFPTHPHRDMEILSYVIEGALGHEDSMKNGSVIRPGELQRMTAGTGVTHSEMNASASEPVHFLQIWLLPKGRGIAPGYAQKSFPREAAFTLLASPDGEAGSIQIHADARLTVVRQTHTVSLVLSRHAWVQVIVGRFVVEGATLEAGDGAAASDAAEVHLEGSGEALVFDLA